MPQQYWLAHWLPRVSILRPAINVGISVSRVGSAAQPKIMKQVAQFSDSDCVEPALGFGYLERRNLPALHLCQFLDICSKWSVGPYLLNTPRMPVWLIFKVGHTDLRRYVGRVRGGRDYRPALEMASSVGLRR